MPAGPTDKMSVLRSQSLLANSFEQDNCHRSCGETMSGVCRRRYLPHICGATPLSASTKLQQYLFKAS